MGPLDIISKGKLLHFIKTINLTSSEAVSHQIIYRKTIRNIHLQVYVTRTFYIKPGIVSIVLTIALTSLLHENAKTFLFMPFLYSELELNTTQRNGTMSCACSTLGNPHHGNVLWYYS